MARITRKDLKTDKFALEVGHTVDFFEEHRREVVRYGAALSTKRRLYEAALYYCVTKTTRTPIVAFAPMISPLVLRRRQGPDV